MFVEKYTRALVASDLRDDEFHHATDPLHASASADQTGSGAIFGSLLARVKYADGAVHKSFEAGGHNLAALLNVWTIVVTEKGQARKWVPANTAWDMTAAFKLYERVAHASMAHWLDGRCPPCNGAGVMETRRTCTCCAGSGRAQIEAGRFETEIIKDLVSELEGIFQAYSARAASKLRRAA